MEGGVEDGYPLVECHEIHVLELSPGVGPARTQRTSRQRREAAARYRTWLRRLLRRKVKPGRAEQLALAEHSARQRPCPTRVLRHDLVIRTLAWHGSVVTVHHHTVTQPRRVLAPHHNSPLGCPDLLVQVVVLPDPVLQVGDLRLQPGPATPDGSSLLRPPPGRPLQSAHKSDSLRNISIHNY